MLPLLMSVVLAAGGCSSTARAEPRFVSEDPVAQSDFDQARALFQRGEPEAAEPLFESFLIAHPEDPLRPAAELHLGRIAAGQGDHEGAVIFLERAAAAEDDALARAARRELGASLLQLGEAQRALEVLEPLTGYVDGAEAAELYQLLAEAAGSVGDGVRRVRFLDAACRYGGAEVCQRARGAIGEAVAGVDEATLSRLHDDLPRTGQGWVAATSRLGLLAAERGEAERAEALLAELEQADAGEGAPAAALRAAIEQIERVDWNALGVLLPLSGRARLVGEQMRAGLELAAAESEPPLRLVLRDTGAATAEGLAQVVDELARSERVSAIIGPVDNEAARVAAERAQAEGVPLLALSIRPGLPQRGRWVLRPFQSNEAEIRTLVNHGRHGRGMRTFAILYPDSGYGRVLRQLAEAEVAAQGGTLVAAVSYPPQGRAFVEVCRELAGHDFQALILPAGRQTVSLIAPALATAGLWSTPPDRAAPEGGRAIQLLLPSPAFDQRLIRQAGRYLQGAVFAAVLFTEERAEEVSGFVEAYREAQGGAPSPYASQAHDAVQLLLMARAAARGQTRAALLEALLALRAAPTVGRFEGFTEQGEPVAPLSLYRLEGDAFQRIEPAER